MSPGIDWRVWRLPAPDRGQVERRCLALAADGSEYRHPVRHWRPGVPLASATAWIKVIGPPTGNEPAC